MKPNLQRRVQRYGWDKASSHYEGYWQSQLEPAQELLLSMAELQPGEKAVDIACGTGLVTFPAAKAVGAEGRLMATDLSSKMVEGLRQEASRRELKHVEAERMDAETLDLEDDTFDVALNALGLMYVPSPLAAVQEMLRVLKSGGRGVAAVWGERGNCGWAEIFPIVDARVKSEVCPMFFQLGTGGALQIALQTAGFVDLETERISTLLHYESEDQALGAAFAGGPVALAYSRFDDATRDAAHADYLESIAPFRNGEGYEIPGEFVVTRGRKS